jgi:hypothetical protein
MPVVVHCPFHEDSTPSLAIYEDHAFCFGGCGKIPLESIRDLVEKLNIRSSSSREGAADERWRHLLPLWRWNLLMGPMQWRQRFFHERGITTRMMERYWLGHTGRWFVIPVWFGGRITGVRYRRDDLFAEDDDTKYRNPRGHGALLFRPNPGGWPTVITEGELDALLLSEAGCDAVTSTGGAGSLSKIELDEIHWPLFVATDQDDAGEQAWEALAARFRQRIYRWRWPEGKDISEVLSKLPREAWGNWIRERIRECEARGCR